MGKFTIIKSTENYSIISNYHLWDDRLSNATKGILTIMLCLPKDWNFTAQGFEKVSTDGETRIASQLKELEKYGYLERCPIKDEQSHKFVDWEYKIYEKPFRDFPVVEKPVVENQAQLNTYKTKRIIGLNDRKENILKEKTDLVKEIIAYLNAKTGKRFTHTNKETLKHINGRLSEGATLEDFKKVIDIKCSQWLGDTRMEEYLRPSTLFAPSKFESYLNTKIGEQKNENRRINRQCDEYSDER